MNKKMKQQLLFLSVAILFAKNLAAKDSVVLLEIFDSHGKSLGKDVMLVSDEVVIVNKKKLSLAEAIAQSEYIKRLWSFDFKGSPQKCNAGSFRYVSKKGQSQVEEKGCLESVDYVKLKENFSRIK